MGPEPTQPPADYNDLRDSPRNPYTDGRRDPDDLVGSIDAGYGLGGNNPASGAYGGPAGRYYTPPQPVSGAFGANPHAGGAGRSSAGEDAAARAIASGLDAAAGRFLDHGVSDAPMPTGFPGPDAARPRDILIDKGIDDQAVPENERR